MIYCNLISEFVGDSTGRCMGTFPTASCRNQSFQTCQWNNGNFRSYGTICSPSMGCKSPSMKEGCPKNWYFIPAIITIGDFVIKHCVSIHRNTLMHPLEVYYLNQKVRGLTHSRWIGLVYSAPLYVQRGHAIGNFSAGSSAG